MSTRQERTVYNRNVKRVNGLRSGGYGDYYVDGSAAKKLDVREEIQKESFSRTSRHIQKNREKATRMNMGYVLFMVAGIAFASFTLINYISVRAENTAMAASIAQKESQLNNLKLSNDEEYSRIISAVDLEHVKDVAMNELGMQYAQEGQIVNVEIQGDDYVRQYQDMP